MRTPSWTVVGVAVMLGGALLWSSCGGSQGSKAAPRASFVKSDADVAEAEPVADLVFGTMGEEALAMSPPGEMADLGIDPMGADELWIVARFDKAADRPVEPIGSPALRAVVAGEKEQVELPLRHTSVDARINAYVAAVTVAQQYVNPYAEKIEVVYVFPLPQDAAVSEFLMKVGNRTIRGIIRERQEAEQIYREARDAGYTASLLTQERPNVFTQKVANIEPQKEIDIELTYFNTLPYRDGAYVFTFPSVVGPRFNPPDANDGVGAAAMGAGGQSGQPAEVQYLAPHQESSHEVLMTIALDAGVSIESVESPTHRIRVTEEGEGRRQIALLDRTMKPDRDFVLRYRVAGEALKSALITHEDDRGGYFTVVLTPPEDLRRMERAPAEHVFVLDCSGSMNGWPLDAAKETVERVLGRLDDRDTFQIIQFSNNASALGSRPVPATRRNIKQGLRYLRRLDGAGGTMMIEGLKAALDFPHEEGKVRIVTFLTDGFIGNEAEILTAVKQKLGQSRIFSFGVGSAPNRYLLERMAKLGQGAVAYVGQSTAKADQEAVDDFYERVSHPALSDVSVDWGRGRVSEVFPSRIPDVTAGRPVVLTGRFTGRLERDITVHGRIGGERTRFRIPVKRSDTSSNPAIPQIWARMKIMDMADGSLGSRHQPRLQEEIKALALQYGLMSKFTAFIAVDASRKTAGQHGYTVAQPVPVPHGVRYDTTVPE